MLRLGVLGNNDGHVRLAPTGFPYDETEMNEIGRLEPVCSSTRLLSNQPLTSLPLSQYFPDGPTRKPSFVGIPAPRRAIAALN